MRKINQGASISYMPSFVKASGVQSQSQEEILGRQFMKTQDHVYYIEAMHQDKVAFDPVTGEAVEGIMPSGFPIIMQGIKEHSDSEGRYVFALGEKREGASIGHMLTVVVEKEGDSLAIYVLDSKPKSWITRLFQILFGYQFMNSTKALENMLKEAKVGYDSLSRVHYGHQASLLNNYCTAFSAKMIAKVAMSSREEKVDMLLQEKIEILEPRLGLQLFSDDRFLTSSNLNDYEAILNKPVNTSSLDLECEFCEDGEFELVG